MANLRQWMKDERAGKRHCDRSGCDAIATQERGHGQPLCDQHAKAWDIEQDICACYFECRKDSHSGRWHQHEEEPCPVHPDAVMVG